MLCILYVNAIAALLGTSGLLLERTTPANSTRRRWIWSAVIVLTMLFPMVYRMNHTASVPELLRQQAAGEGFGHFVATSPLGIFDPEWWQQTASYNPTIRTLWLIASGALLLWGVATAIRIAVLMSRSRRTSLLDATEVVDGVRVTVTDSIGPATVGVLRSRVVVPRWVLALPGPQRRYVLRHEEEHRRSHDSVLLFAASLTLLLAPWNLALWWQLRRLRLAVELDCDNRVVSALGDRNAYGELLFKVALAANRGPRLQPAFLGAGMLETRLRALVAPEPLRQVQRFLLPALACAIFLLVIAIPHPVLGSRSTPHSHHSPEATNTR